MKKNPRRLIPVVVVIALLAAGAWYLFQARGGSIAGSLKASGTIEATNVQIATEFTGRVVQVMADKGQAVKAGDPLLCLDDQLLQAQRSQTATALQAAKDNLATAKSGVEVAASALNQAKVSAQVAHDSAQAQLLPAQKSLDDLYKNAEVAKTLAQQAVSAATRAVRDAQYQVDNYDVPNDQQEMTAAEAVPAMRLVLDKARAAFEPYKYEDSGNQTRKDLKEALDNAQSDYDAAVRRLELESALQQAQARESKALQDLKDVQNGPKAEDVAIFKAQITAIQSVPTQAGAAVELAQQNVTQVQTRLEQAQSALAQAQAALDLIDVQLKKLVVYAPASGVVLSRDIEPGEVAPAGASVMTTAQLDPLNITVYVPEDRYGQIHLGETAQVSVDSYPGKPFKAIVTHIADQAEFTPRNVQTAEGRRTTVFAVELSIENSDGNLKPGMPSDVCFGCG